MPKVVKPITPLRRGFFFSQIYRFLFIFTKYSKGFSMTRRDSRLWQEGVIPSVTLRQGAIFRLRDERQTGTERPEGIRCRISGQRQSLGLQTACNRVTDGV